MLLFGETCYANWCLILIINPEHQRIYLSCLSFLWFIDHQPVHNLMLFNIFLIIKFDHVCDSTSWWVWSSGYLHMPRY